MAYYELKKLKRGGAPDSLLPHIRPASDRDQGSELFEAKDDDQAAAYGRGKELQLGADYIIAVYDVRDGERIMIYPRPNQDA